MKFRRNQIVWSLAIGATLAASCIALLYPSKPTLAKTLTIDVNSAEKLLADCKRQEGRLFPGDDALGDELLYSFDRIRDNEFFNVVIAVGAGDASRREKLVARAVDCTHSSLGTYVHVMEQDRRTLIATENLVRELGVFCSAKPVDVEGQLARFESGESHRNNASGDHIFRFAGPDLAVAFYISDDDAVGEHVPADFPRNVARYLVMVGFSPTHDQGDASTMDDFVHAHQR